MLTDKQNLVADEYLVYLNVTSAYKITYPNTKKDETLASLGARMIRNDKGAAYIQEQMKDHSNFTEINPDWVLNELLAVAKVNGTDFVKVVEEPMIVRGHYVMDTDSVS